MKTKRFISIIMTVVMMLSVVFCAVPTASAKTTPKITYAAGIYGREVKNSYKLPKGYSYFISNNFSFNSKPLKYMKTFEIISLGNATTSNPHSVSVDHMNSITNSIKVHSGNNRRVKITSYLKITKNKKKINKYINFLPHATTYTSSEVKAIKNYLYSNAGKKISDSFYVYPQSPSYSVYV